MSTVGIRTPNSSEEMEAEGFPQRLVDFLPTEVLLCIMERVNDLVDICALICTCRQFRALARAVPFNAKLSNSRYVPSSRAQTRAVLKTVRCYMPSTRVLDLAGTWIVDDDVAAVLADLKNLDCLVLDGCPKLTSCVADALAVSVRSGPRAVSLQRCFGMGPTAAGNLLAAASVNGSRLECILFSHLDRLDIPRDTSLVEMETGNCKNNTLCANSHWLKPSNVGTGLRILALNNCACVGHFEVVAVATVCPLLEMWMLGGSVEGLGLFRSDNLSEGKTLTAVSVLVKATECLAKLCVLEITFFPNSIVQSVRAEIRKEIQVWDFCQKWSVMSAILYLDGCTQVPIPNNLPLASSKIKKVIADVSANLSRVSDNIKEDLISKTNNDHQDEKIGLTSSRKDLIFALHAAANCSDTRRRTPLHVAALLGDSDTVECLLAIGAEVKGMKDSAGATALFVAAECGYANVCELLLQGGADVLACNRAGENPLYIAALRGHCEAVEGLVRHCSRNNIIWQGAKAYGDGWTPLMAAAVADRQDVAKILLQAVNINPSKHLDDGTFTENAICILKDKRTQMDKSDIYTTKMCKILQENEFVWGNSQNSTDWKHQISTRIQLLDAQNRYRQTALHIAARRASIWFVCNLLMAGASMDIRDCYMMRALDVAHHHNHKVVANIIKNWESIQWSRNQVKSQQPLLKIQKNLSFRNEHNDNDASTSSSICQSNKNKNSTVEIHKTKDNAPKISCSKFPEDHGKSTVVRYWRVKGGQKRETSPGESSSGT